MKGLRLTARGELVAEILALAGAIVSVASFAIIVYLIGSTS